MKKYSMFSWLVPTLWIQLQKRDDTWFVYRVSETECRPLTAFRDVPVVPCRVSAEIPKDMIFPVMKEINRARVTKRIGRGEIIIPNVLGIGADIICTSDILKSGEEN